MAGAGRIQPGWATGPRERGGSSGGDQPVRGLLAAATLCKKLCPLHCQERSPLLKKATAIQQTADAVRYSFSFSF
jgi:hypothetical protein